MPMSKKIDFSKAYGSLRRELQRKRNAKWTIDAMHRLSSECLCNWKLFEADSSLTFYSICYADNEIDSIAGLREESNYCVSNNTSNNNSTIFTVYTCLVLISGYSNSSPYSQFIHHDEKQRQHQQLQHHTRSSFTLSQLEFGDLAYKNRFH